MVDGFLHDMIPGGVGVFGGLVKWALNRRHEIDLLRLQNDASRREGYQTDVRAARKYNTPWANATRLLMTLFLLILVTGGLLVGAFKGLVINTESLSEGSFLHNLFFNSPVHQWALHTGLVLPHQVWELLFFICGFYFGSVAI